jgi:hypothetical protein
LEAVVDLRNLLAQGYVPVLENDGHGLPGAWHGGERWRGVYFLGNPGLKFFPTDGD